MSRDAIMTELLEIEALLQDDRLNDNDRHAAPCRFPAGHCLE
jgi:hypothetical protein